jgi:hypothetical protein
LKITPVHPAAMVAVTSRIERINKLLVSAGRRSARCSGD